MTSKQRSYLKGLAMTIDPIFQLGKSSLTPENTKAIEEALNARELIKINVLQNCADDPNEMAQILAERTRSQVVQVIGKRLYYIRNQRITKESNFHRRKGRKIMKSAIGIMGGLLIRFITDIYSLHYRHTGSLNFQRCWSCRREHRHIKVQRN